MKPVVVKYRLKHHLYNLDDDYPLSCLVLDICSDLDIHLNGVQFTLKCGSILPEVGKLSDIPDFENSKLVRVFVEDVPCVDDSDYDIKDGRLNQYSVDAVPITITLPSKKVVQKTVKPDETMASIIGELILEDMIDLNIDTKLIRKKKQSNSESRDRSPVRSGDVADIVKNFGYDCKIIDKFDIEEGDTLQITDREAIKQSQKLGQTDLFVRLKNSKKNIPWPIFSASTCAEAFGSLLASGRLGTKFELQLVRKSEDSDEEEECSPATDISDIFNSDFDKRQSLIKLLDLKEGDTLNIKTSDCDVDGIIKDYAHINEVIEDVEIKFQGLVNDQCKTFDLVVKKAETVSMFVKRLIGMGLDEIENISVDGRFILDSKIALADDSRSLISDCGVKPGSTVVAKKSFSQLSRVVLVRAHSINISDERRFVDVRTNATGMELKLKISEVFNICKDGISFMFQYGKRLPNTDTFGIECESDGKADWHYLDYNSPVSSDPRMYRELEPDRLMIVPIKDNDRFINLQGSTAIIYFWNDFLFYLCPEVPDKEFILLPRETDPWNDEQFVAFIQGIRVMDKVDKSKVRYFVNVSNYYANLLTGLEVSRGEFYSSKFIDIPSTNRTISRIIIFMKKKAFIPVCRGTWSRSNRIKVWMRQNYVGKCDESGTLRFNVNLTTPRIANDPFQWQRVFKGHSAFEDRWAVIIRS